MTPAFPVDDILPDLVRALEVSRAVVLEAPPGAGKTTRVPLALLRTTEGQVLVVEPRRLAARLAAEHVASGLGETAGGTIGYSVRFDDRTSDRTRVRYLTGGLLLAELAGNPDLTGVGAVLFDEIHERHLSDDLLLAWCLRLQRTTRPDLRLVAMSATLDAGPIAQHLDAPMLRAEGRRFPVVIEHQERRDERPLAGQVAAALRANAERLDGDVLVFLPGVGDIERCRRGCADLARQHGWALLPLHGSLDPAGTREALRPRRERRIILATNIAESSLTLDGVTLVIDGGLHKVARSSAWSGLTRLELEPIPRDSATQRAGRAGRTAPGRCVRLYTETDLRSRPERLEPEIQRTDITAEVLQLACLGVTDRDALPWLDTPPEARWQTASRWLRGAGLLGRTPHESGPGFGTSEAEQVTGVGRDVARLPLHPRHGVFLMEAARLGAAPQAARAVALLSEGARLPDGLSPTDSDLTELRERGRGQSGRVAKQLQNLVRRVRPDSQAPATDRGEALRLAALLAFPDRVGRRRSARGTRFAMAEGDDTELDPRSTVRNWRWIVAIETAADPRGGRPVVRIACGIEPEWLLELPGAEQDLSETVDVRWNDRSERVEASRTFRWRGLELERNDINARESDEARELLVQKARAAGPGRFADLAAVDELMARRNFAHSVDETVPALDEDAVLDTIEQLCFGASGFKDLQKANLFAHLEGQLDWPTRQRLDALAPTHVNLSSGRRARVRYPRVGAPRVSAPIQHFLGMADGPRLGAGRVPVLLELLAPNRRPAQLTDDLAGFWARTWPEVRKELRGRYPKHAWPEDPLAPPERRR